MLGIIATLLNSFRCLLFIFLDSCFSDSASEFTALLLHQFSRWSSMLWFINISPHTHTPLVPNYMLSFLAHPWHVTLPSSSSTLFKMSMLKLFPSYISSLISCAACIPFQLEKFILPFCVAYCALSYHVSAVAHALIFLPFFGPDYFALFSSYPVWQVQIFYSCLFSFSWSLFDMVHSAMHPFIKLLQIYTICERDYVSHICQSLLKISVSLTYYIEDFDFKQS